MSTRGLLPADLLRLRGIEDPQLDGTGRVAFTLASVDAAGRNQRDIWVIDGPQGTMRRLTAGSGREHSPRWSPDGRWLSFISDRAGSPQLWCLPLNGGDPRPLTHLPAPVTEHVWSPDGSMLAFLSRATSAGPAEPALAGAAPDVRVIDRVHYKQNGEGIFGRGFAQLFVATLDSGEVRQLTFDPSPVAHPFWSPDGSSLTFIGRRASASPEDDWSPLREIWTVRPDGQGLRCLTDAALAMDVAAWTPDGGSLIVVGHDNSAFDATVSRLWGVRPDGAPAAGSRQLLSTGWEGEVSGLRPVCEPDGPAVYFVGEQSGQVGLYRASRNGGPVEPVLGGLRALKGISLDPQSGEYAALWTDPVTPGDLWRGHLADPATERRVTEINGDALAGVALSVPVPVTTAPVDGIAIQGWLLPPVGQRPGDRHPAVLAIHGGPHAAYRWAFEVDMQCMAGAGFVVVYGNPGGSIGYGQELAARILPSWGTSTHHDLMALVDAAMETTSLIAGDQLAVTGASFGGYMTNWVISHTDRFKAAVSVASITDRISFVGTNAMGYRRMLQYGGPWDSPEFYWETSPLAHAHKIRTPLLLIHGEQDLTCPISQAEELFIALMRLGTEVRLARYPGEPHGFQQPAHRVDRLCRTLAWFHGHLNPPKVGEDARP